MQERAEHQSALATALATARERAAQPVARQAQIGDHACIGVAWLVAATRRRALDTEPAALTAWVAVKPPVGVVPLWAARRVVEFD